jgi:hypothetical protein
MIFDGIYSASFVAGGSPGGTGVVVVEGGRLQGGDSAYFYKGKFRLADPNGTSAVVDVQRYSNIFDSIFGKRDSYRLILTGVAEGDGGFTLSGHIEGEPQSLIMIKLARIADLVEGEHEK